MNVKVSLGDWEHELQEFNEQTTKQLIRFFAYIGEAAVKDARLNGAYKDQSGNLRSSITYGVFLDGEPVEIGTPQTYGKDGKAGANEAQQLLMAMGAESRDLALIVVAGKNYASYVENIHHLNVLASAELKVKQLAQKLIEGL